MKLPEIYPVTSRELSGLSHAEQIRSLGEAGCKFAQIREKSATSREFYDAVAQALAVASQFGMTVIVNDRVDVAIAAGAQGIHLGQDDLSPIIARRLLGDEAIIGYSTHTVEQAIDAAAMPVDYVAIGPVFATTTKEKPDPVVGLDGIRKVRAALRNVPLVAIGGITRENIAGVLDSGADSAAVISELFDRDDRIGARYLQLVRATVR